MSKLVHHEKVLIGLCLGIVGFVICIITFIVIMTLNNKNVECEHSTDCSNNYICKNEKCIKEPVPFKCTHSTDCSNNYICKNEKCIKEPVPFKCTHSTDCSNNYICKNKKCIKDPVPSDISKYYCVYDNPRTDINRTPMCKQYTSKPINKLVKDISYNNFKECNNNCLSNDCYDNSCYNTTMCLQNDKSCRRCENIDNLSIYTIRNNSQWCLGTIDICGNMSFNNKMIFVFNRDGTNGNMSFIYNNVSYNVKPLKNNGTGFVLTDLQNNNITTYSVSEKYKYIFMSDMYFKSKTIKYIWIPYNCISTILNN